VLRKRDAAKAELRGDESDDELISLMADNPRLLQRPIGVVGAKAVVGRPVENLLTIV
jgi:arsenate reductase